LSLPPPGPPSCTVRDISLPTEKAGEVDVVTVMPMNATFPWTSRQETVLSKACVDGRQVTDTSPVAVCPVEPWAENASWAPELSGQDQATMTAEPETASPTVADAVAGTAKMDPNIRAAIDMTLVRPALS
jgi:hypothetical protein